MGTKTQGTASVSSEQRRQMVAEAAYYRAEHNGFSGDSIEDWLAAEEEIDRLLLRHSTPRNEAESKHSFQGLLEDQLKEWDEKLEELSATAKQAGTNLNKEIHGQLEMLAQKRSTAQHRLAELRDHSAGRWDELRDGAEQLLDDLRGSIAKLAARLNTGAKNERADAPRSK
jgi:DNA anti-recombination protein RmuC